MTIGAALLDTCAEIAHDKDKGGRRILEIKHVILPR